MLKKSFLRIQHVLSHTPKLIRKSGGVLKAIKRFFKVFSDGRLVGFSSLLDGSKDVNSSDRPLDKNSQHTNVLLDADGQNYLEWVRCFDTIDESSRHHLLMVASKLRNQPLISILMPVYNGHLPWITQAIDSVRNQIYSNWELCIADDASSNIKIKPLLEKYAQLDPRIKLIFREKNGHISATSNSALSLATGKWIALLDHDDLLPEHALTCVAIAINEHPSAGLIYSDEDNINTDNQRCSPYFKPDWNLDLFRSQNMISHLGCFRRDLIEKVGGFREGFEGSQDYDLALRVIEHLNSEQIIHIPKILYHWRIHSESTAKDLSVKPYAVLAAQKALKEHLYRQNVKGEVSIKPLKFYRINYELPNKLPWVSIIITTHDQDSLIKDCIKSILEKTTYNNYEVIIINNGLTDNNYHNFSPELYNYKKIKIINLNHKFNHSLLNNTASKQAIGDYLVFLNSGVQVITSTWLEEMLGIAIQPCVGAVGARLWKNDDTIHHAGLILGIHDVATFAFQGMPSNQINSSYGDRAELTQSYSALSGACLMVNKTIFEKVNGFNEQYLPMIFSDLDLCLALIEAGYRNVWTPYAEFYYHDPQLITDDVSIANGSCYDKELNFIKMKWTKYLFHDRAYNPNLNNLSSDFSLAWPPRITL